MVRTRENTGRQYAQILNAGFQDFAPLMIHNPAASTITDIPNITLSAMRLKAVQARVEGIPERKIPAASEGPDGVLTKKATQKLLSTA